MSKPLQENRPNGDTLYGKFSDASPNILGFCAMYLCLRTMFPSTRHHHVTAATWIFVYEGLNLVILTAVYIWSWARNRKEPDPFTRRQNLRTASMTASVSMLITAGYGYVMMFREVSAP